MEKYYKISRVVICIITVVISFIALINEDISFKLICIPLFTCVAFAISFASTAVSRRMLNIGDNRRNRLTRILYYISVFVMIIFVALATYVLMTSAYLDSDNPTLSGAVFTILLCALIFIAVIVPYIQTMIVLLLRTVDKNKSGRLL